MCFYHNTGTYIAPNVAYLAYNKMTVQGRSGRADYGVGSVVPSPV